MEETLQHDETTFSTGIQAAGTGGHHPNRPKAGHALTFKLDQLEGAGHILRDALRPAESTASTRQDGFISENLRLRIVVMRRRALFNTKKTTIGAITTH